MSTGNMLLNAGRFVIGCNYWASHAGTAMWSDWRPEIVEKDLKELSEAGMQVLRVFPLWSDFQPIHELYGCGGEPAECRLGETPLPEDALGQAGIRREMMERFGQLASLADKYGLKLIVSLLAGWMSGRLFVPPALVNRNLITDPIALVWEVRFVRQFVRHFRDAQAILAWEPGNECNCLATSNRPQAWVWCSAITDAIRSIDSDRPVISGMHGLGVDAAAPWTIRDQAELTDLLTVHPYPLFTRYCGLDAVNTIRPCLHATAEAQLYGGVARKPCMVEEIGTLGPMVAGEAVAADYTRTVLFSTWAHDGRGFLWWCGHDQSHLEHAPYDWCAVERELGLFRMDGSLKPVGAAMKNFRQFLDTLPFETLPARMTDAVCILTQGQDAWAAAFGSFILGKQAGIEMEFQCEDQPVGPASLYLMPSMCGLSSIKRRSMLKILERVREGAVLYISVGDALLSPFEEITGLEVQARQHRVAPAEAVFDGADGKFPLPVLGDIKLSLRATQATVLARENDGNPAFTCFPYGKGRVYFLAFPMEQELVKTAGSFYGPLARPYWSVYRTVANSLPSQRALAKSDPRVGVTEHSLEKARRVIVAINYSPESVDLPVTMDQDWRVNTVLYGQMGPAQVLKLKPNDAAVMLVAATS